jgi:hypothetical protein
MKLDAQAPSRGVANEARIRVADCLPSTLGTLHGSRFTRSREGALDICDQAFDSANHHPLRLVSVQCVQCWCVLAYFAEAQRLDAWLAFI